jgi:hypothetical protein
MPDDLINEMLNDGIVNYSYEKKYEIKNKRPCPGADRAAGILGFSWWAAAYIDENGPIKNITTNTIIHVHIYK